MTLQFSPQTRRVFHLSLPIFAELLLQLLVGNMDQFMISHFGSAAVAAIGNGNQVMNVVIIVLTTMSTAATILLTQHIGAGRVGKECSEIVTVAVTVSAVMQPFVRSADDLCAVRAAMADSGLAHAELFAKVENRAGLDALPDWMDLCDVVTIARGDLGSSLPLEQLPAAQKHIAALCRSRRKPFLVVTQLLHSMIDHPAPTRAEVLDIYNAVLDGADCLMLTGETAQGRYPAEASAWLIRVAREAEKTR